MAKRTPKAPSPDRWSSRVALARRLLAPLARPAGKVISTFKFLAARPVRFLWLFLALGGGAAIGLIPGQMAYNYMWRDYRFCNDCHVHDYANDAFERSIHFGLTTCHDCHRVPIRHYPKNLHLALFDRPQGQADIHRPDVESVVCVQCHSAESTEPLTGPLGAEARARVVKVDESPLHLAHMGSTTRDPGTYRGGAEGHGEGSDAEHAEEGHGAGGGGHGGGHGQASWDAGLIHCADCHGGDPNRAHRFRASSENCLECHEALKLRSPRLEHLPCLECHLWGFAGHTIANPPSPDGLGPG